MSKALIEIEFAIIREIYRLIDHPRHRKDIINNCTLEGDLFNRTESQIQLLDEEYVPTYKLFIAEIKEVLRQPTKQPWFMYPKSLTEDIIYN